jgi:hypothetical protein
MSVCVLGPFGSRSVCLLFSGGAASSGVILDGHSWDMLQMGCDGECLSGPGVSVPYSRGSVGLGLIVVVP